MKEDNNIENLDFYGIKKEKAHAKAIELATEDFFWDCLDELAPFGSDEGDTALTEYRAWRKDNPTCPSIDCLEWVIEDVGEMKLEAYNEELLAQALLEKQIRAKNFDDEYYIYTLDRSIIATGFAQLVDEGLIPAANKPIIKIALQRQKLWTALQKGWEYAVEYTRNLESLERILEAA